MPKLLPQIKSRVFKKPKGKDLKQTVNRLRDLCRVLDEVSTLYKERDELTLSIVGVPSHELERYGCVLVDNFKSQITAFKKTTAFTRYKVEFSQYSKDKK